MLIALKSELVHIMSIILSEISSIDLKRHTAQPDFHRINLTSNPCFSEGTHTSLLAAQSACLEAENTEVDDSGPAPVDRKWVTSLTLPPAGLDMVVALCRRRKE